MAEAHEMESEGNRITTAVRVRPLSTEEESSDFRLVVSLDIDKSEVVLLNPVFYTSSNQSEKLRKLEERSFACDCPFWSVDETHPDYCGQAMVYEKIGKPIVEHAFQGMNCSLFAYGQTGSGKTHTMMGNVDTEDAGVIPRLCRSVMSRAGIARAASTADINEGEETRVLDVTISVAYFEIYNERIYDLISSSPTCPCKVREHPEEGAYVENVTKREVQTYEEVHQVLEEGHANRQTAETLMNASSSRSHAVFTVFIQQRILIPGPPGTGDTKKRCTPSDVILRKSKVCLIDLAGSERLNSTGATGDRLKEATNINRSLFVLGEVIKALSESLPGAEKFVPYRNSILTWILKDSLGGNSKTTMLATISPISASYAETMNTLRYVERAKLIVSRAVVNDDNSNDPYVKHLQQQVALYKSKLSAALVKLRECEEDFQRQLKELRCELEKAEESRDGADGGICGERTAVSSSRNDGSASSSPRSSRDMTGATFTLGCGRALRTAESTGDPGAVLSLVLEATRACDVSSAASSVSKEVVHARGPCVDTPMDLRVDLLSEDGDAASDIVFSDVLAVDLSRMDSIDSATDDEALHSYHRSSELKQLRDALNMSMLEYNVLNQQMVEAEDMHRIEIEYLEERLQSTESELQALRTPRTRRKDDSRAGLVHLEEQMTSLNNIVEQLQVRLTAKDAEMREAAEGHRDRVNDLTAQCTAALMDADMSRRELHLRAEQHVVDTQSIQAQVDSLRHSLSEADAMRDATEAQVAELASIVAQQQREYTANEAKSRQKLVDMTDTHERLLADERQKCAEQQKAHEASLAGLQTALDNLTSRYNLLTSTQTEQLVDKQKQVDAAVSALASLQEEFTAAQTSHRESLELVDRRERQSAAEREGSAGHVRDMKELLAEKDLHLIRMSERCRELEDEVSSLAMGLMEAKANDRAMRPREESATERSLRSQHMCKKRAADTAGFLQRVYSQLEAIRDHLRRDSGDSPTAVGMDWSDGALSAVLQDIADLAESVPSHAISAEWEHPRRGEGPAAGETGSSDNEATAREECAERESCSQEPDLSALLQDKGKNCIAKDIVSALEAELRAERGREEALESSLKCLEEENQRLRLQLESVMTQSSNLGKSKRCWFMCS